MKVQLQCLLIHLRTKSGQSHLSQTYKKATDLTAKKLICFNFVLREFNSDKMNSRLTSLQK